MSASGSFRSGRFPLIASGVVFVLGAAVSVLAGSLDVERRASEEHSRVLAELAVVRARVDGVIKATFSSTDGLGHLISLQGGISPELFAEMAKRAIGKNPHVRNITLAPDDRVTMVYPLAGNEKVIGFKFASVPEQNRTVQLARERQAPLLAGPVELIQGGRALIQRAPLFVRQAGEMRYYGALSVVAYVDGLLFPEGKDKTPDIRVAIRGKDGLGAAGAMVDGDPGIFAAAPVLMDVEVPGGSWQLAAVPAAGWARGSLLMSPYCQLGLVISVLIALVTGLRTSLGRQLGERNAVLEREILERQRAESALREEEERFRTLFEASPDPAWILEGSAMVRCNAAAARIFGADHPAFYSPPLQPDGRPSQAKAEEMIALAQRHGSHRFEWLHTRADGAPLHAEVTLVCLTMRGKPVTYGVVHDISERKHAEEELQTSRKLLQAIVDSAGAVIYAFDRDARLMLCNQQFEAVFARSRSTMIGRRREAFMPVEVAREHEANDRVVIAAGALTSFEERNIEAGEHHDYLTVKCPIFDGDEILGVVGISTDITERKHDEERLKLAAAVLESTGEGVVITDVEARIVAVNRAFSEITGYSEAEALGQRPSLLRSEHQGGEFYREMWRELGENDSWRGEIWNRRKSGEVYPEWLVISAIRNDRGEVTHYVGVFSDISTLKHSQARLEHLAHFDSLTDLPNRILFQDRLGHAIDRAQRYGHGIGVLVLDLDGFKTVNDSLGHPVGDQLLSQVAERLAHCVRVEDTVARLGGDEFAVILSQLADGSDAVEVVRKILASIEQPFDLSGTGALISASIGIAVYPADGQTATELVRNADAAMYGAKEAGRNTYRFYQATMTRHAQERLHREAALRRGVERREFEVWFQPQISLHNGRLTGAEGLVRWRDPERGLISPAEFIPLAERTGLILPLGEQVLAEVCACARRWLDEGLCFGRLAVNVATPQIERGDFVGLVRQQLAAHRLPPDCLEIEITESFIMGSAVAAREALLAIQALGVTTAVDDFGTGYSSLSYLKELPIDNLKIDRAFVKDLPGSGRDIAITRAIIAMAHSLGFKVTAEGIENQAQQDWLYAEGCDEVQGYFISRPQPADEFASWLRKFQSLRG